MDILQKIDAMVSKECAAYFKAVWIKENGLTKKQYRNRMKNATLEDVALFCHVCNFDEKEIMKPLKEKLLNVPPYGVKNFQTTIEP